MALLTTQTLRPIAVPQTGSWTTSTGTALAALADGLDTTYVQQASRSRNDEQVLRMEFAAPTLPAGAKVYSVIVRDRIQTVVSPGPTEPPPRCLHWLRSLVGEIRVSGMEQEAKKAPFTSTCPTSATPVWEDRTHRAFESAPGGEAWDVDTNLDGLYYDLGRSDDGSGNVRYAAVYLDITYQQASTITITGPAGTLTDTRPTISWLYSSPDSQPQQAYQVVVYTAAQVAAVGFVPFVTPPQQSSGVILGEALQWTLTQDVVDGSYVAFVQATSKWAGLGEFPTEIASTSWTRAATPANPPPAPVLYSATFDPTGAGRVPLTFGPGGSGSDPETVCYTVQESKDNGVVFIDIPHLRYLPANGTSVMTEYAYTAALNVTTKYRVIAYTGSPLVASANPSLEKSVEPIGNLHALIHPGDPLLSTILPVGAPKGGSGIKITRRQIQGTHQPVGGIGKVFPIVTQGPIFGYEFDIETLFVRGQRSDTYWAAVDQIVDSGVTLLFNRPNGDQYWVSVGPGAGGRDNEETYDAVPGNPRAVYWRRLKFTLTEVAPPAYY